jgi:hypothetical protein
MFSLLLICSQNIVGFGEMSSPNNVIDVVIDGGKQKSPGRRSVTPAGAEVSDFWPTRISRVPRLDGRLPGGC